MALDERALFTKEAETRPGRYQCPKCRRTGECRIRWVRHSKKGSLPAGGDAGDLAKFAKLRDYLLRLDDDVTCKTCGKRFEIPSQHSLMFVDQLAGLPNDEDLDREINAASGGPESAPDPIVVRHPLTKDPSEMALVEWDQPVQTLPPHRVDQSLTEGVRLRSPHGCFEHPSSHRRDRPVHARRVNKRWLLGTHHGGVTHEHLAYYLDEFTFRFNRRRSRSRGKLFFRLVQHAVAVDPAPYESLVRYARFS